MNTAAISRLPLRETALAGPTQEEPRDIGRPEPGAVSPLTRVFRTHRLPQAERATWKSRLQDAPPRAAGFGHAPLDALFAGGGLAAGTHQAAGEGAAALGFGLALAVRTLADRPTGRALLVEVSEAGRETGFAYAPGLQAMGLDPDCLGVARVRSEAEALRVIDEALRSGAVATVLADLGRASRLDLSITRRFNLSARRAGTLCVLVTEDLEETSAALTRWRVEPAASRDEAWRKGRRRLGRPVFELRLLRNRLGPTGDWTLEWDCDDRVFRPAPPLSAPVARPIVDRSDTSRQPDPGIAPGAYRQAV